MRFRESMAAIPSALAGWCPTQPVKRDQARPPYAAQASVEM
jgi:hypothetical protein